MLILRGGSDVEVANVKRIGFDEITSRFNVITHQRGKNFVGRDGVFDGVERDVGHGVIVAENGPDLLPLGEIKQFSVARTFGAATACCRQ